MLAATSGRDVGGTFVAGTVVAWVDGVAGVGVNNSLKHATTVAIRAIFTYATSPHATELTVATTPIGTQAIALVRPCGASRIAHGPLPSDRVGPRS